MHFSVGGEAIRAASLARCTATRRLVSLVRERAHPNGRLPSEPTLVRVRVLLQTAAAHPLAGARLRAGRLTEETGADLDIAALLLERGPAAGAGARRSGR